MTNQNVENLLNLALDATEEEREKSLELGTGYQIIENEWDVIVKYSGSLAAVREFAVSVTELRNEYAILRLKEADVERLSEIPEVEYIEKPKRLFFQTEAGRRASCTDQVQDIRFFPEGILEGRGVLVAVLDSGIDYASPDFRNPDGTTRIYRLWDQTIPGSPPDGYASGTVYTKEQIDEALASTEPGERGRLVPSRDTSGHGTAVAQIAAGNGRGSGPEGRGMAPESELLIVKLGVPEAEGFPRTTELMTALNYAVEEALKRRMPLAVNISIGNNYGSHDGTSLLERFIDDISNLWKSVICIGSGNEGAAAGHTSGRLAQGERRQIPFAVQENQMALSVQIWKNYADDIQIAVTAPSGARVGPVSQVLGPQRFRIGQTEILLYYGKPGPYSTVQEIYLDFLPVGEFVGSGVWNIELTALRTVQGTYDMWLPSSAVLNAGTGFLYPEPDTTLTIPSTAFRVITVGAYNAATLTYADFSGRGYTRQGGTVKPDIVAPGVDVTVTAPGGSRTVVSGTSFATPFATGGAALLMEWGIVRGNDPFLYGEKVKAYFQGGAGRLPGFSVYPNRQTGYGTLCVRDSIPV